MIERIEQFIKSQGISTRSFEQKISASDGMIRRAINNKTDIQSKWITLIADNYPQLSVDWLITGRGSMLRSDQQALVSYEPAIGVPYYDVDFIAGFEQIFNDQTLLPSHNIVFKPFEKATLWCNVTGHSMEKKINHGDIIALKECTVNDVQYGEIYAVVLDTIRTVKILRKSEDPNKFRYVPVNKAEYDDQDFDKSRIIKIYEVLGSISKFF
ncbi:MAG: S24 family peptidase [Bacteroides sp.]|nr:S24 family peptidase [Bacteroides sp.]